MVIILKLVCIKAKNDDSFRIFKAFGTKIYEIEDLEQIDSQIKQCVKNNYNTILISEELANFSGDIITKYKNSSTVNIIISNKKRQSLIAYGPKIHL